MFRSLSKFCTPGQNLEGDSEFTVEDRKVAIARKAGRAFMEGRDFSIDQLQSEPEFEGRGFNYAVTYCKKDLGLSYRSKSGRTTFPSSNQNLAKCLMALEELDDNELIVLAADFGKDPSELLAELEAALASEDKASPDVVTDSIRD